MLSSRGYNHSRLRVEQPHLRAELVAKQILRNDQDAVRSAKETILDMIGRDLDDQLKIEAINGYSMATRVEVKDRLQMFYDKTDSGRHGKNETPLS